MTRHYLTDQDLEVLNSGDLDAIKRHVNQMRGELDLNQAVCRETCIVGEITYHVMFVYSGPVTLCAIAWRVKGRLNGVQGASFCNPKDIYDAAVGERLAMKRACGIGKRYVYLYHRLNELYDAWRFQRWCAARGVEAR